MGLSDCDNDRDFNTEAKVTALHKLYHDDGKSFYSAKSESIYHSTSIDTQSKLVL